MTRFDLLKNVTTPEKMADLICDQVRFFKTPERIAENLRSEVSEDELLRVNHIARLGYPLSLDGLQ